MIKVYFFAQTRETIGCDQCDIVENFATVDALRQHLSTKGSQWQKALNQPALIVAVNQSIASFDSPLQANDEVAFFPPVTGG